MNDHLHDDLHDALHDLLAPLPAPPALDSAVLRRGARRRQAKLAAVGAGGALTLVAVVGAVALGFDGGGPSRLPASATPIATSSAATSSAPPSTSSAPPSSAPTSSAPSSTTTSTTPPSKLAPVVLEADGLGYVSGASSIRHEKFGTTSSTTITQVVASLLGEAGARNALPDCSPSIEVLAFPTAAEVLSLYLDGERFVGWTVTRRVPAQPSSEHLATAAGIGIGSSLADLRSTFAAVEVTTGSVGPEWSVAGGLAGGLDGTRPSDVVTRIGAGRTCVSR
jgi:hypothetical protein